MQRIQNKTTLAARHIVQPSGQHPTMVASAPAVLPLLLLAAAAPLGTSAAWVNPCVPARGLLGVLACAAPV
jgi:hypothetical protein